MSTPAEAQSFLDEAEFLLHHLFVAIEHYDLAVASIQEEIKQIEDAENLFAGLFVERDQWSPNANHYYVQYVDRMKALRAQKTPLQAADALDMQLARMGASVGALALAAGPVLQVGKQTLAFRFGGKNAVLMGCGGSRQVGAQDIVELIWEGRNHGMHFEQGNPSPGVQAMLNDLQASLGQVVDHRVNNSLTILRALGWNSSQDVLTELRALVA